MIEAVAAAQPARVRLLTPVFTLLAVAQVATYAAEFFSYVALSWLAIQLTGSGVVLGALLATQGVARAGLMLVGGAATDRLSPFLVMVVTAVARAALVGGLAALVLTGQARAWELFPIGIAVGALGAFFMPARTAALPAVVGREQLEAANAVMFIVSQVAAVSGPALAGLVVARWGSGPAFVVDAAGFAVAAVACLPLLRRHASTAEDRAPSAILAAIRAGFDFVWGDATLRAIWLGVIALNFAANGPFEIGVTVIAKQRWGGAWALGVEIGSIALGAMLGAAASSKLRDRLPLGPGLVVVSATFGVGLPLIGLAPSVWPAALVTCLLGITNGYLFVIGMSWMQRRTPAEMMGRVMSLLMFGSFGVGPLSYAIAGSLAGLGIELVFVLGGAVCLAVAVAVLANPAVRTAR